MKKNKIARYTKEQDEFIRANYKGVSSSDLAKIVNEKLKTNYTTKQMQNFKSSRGLASGYNAKFKKGDIPYTAGKKWDDFMSKEAQEKALETTFKKGSVPHNHRPVGSENICSQDGYTIVKVKEPNVWKFKHRLLWEKHNGKIKKGHNIIFLNQDRTDIRIENLSMVSYEDAGIMRGWKLFDSDPEITKTGSLVAKIQSKILDLEKGE